MAYSINDANIAWFFTWTGAEKIQLYVTKMFKYDVNTAQVNRNGKRKMEKKYGIFSLANKKNIKIGYAQYVFILVLHRYPLIFFLAKFY